ncbi:hypothetical protein D9M09_14850 [Janthinobacterium agaricidamnosum]|uniref:Uncharacterized protein n=1 Tax=Janthinobacterium agaricidamnosum TaxID=55508 RepID=A0A3G2EBK7_9BURK|nr:hypothetical protein [Janthinobacterium agaricidamnosum]AYM76936.1 hypothetical protein D9M09_14850 [Janthinobacterium agaricidamnosum]
MSDHKALIESLGGATKLAERLGYDKQGGVQRVQNWTVRGVPPKVQLAHPEIFFRQAEAAALRRDTNLAPDPSHEDRHPAIINGAFDALPASADIVIDVGAKP